MTKKSIEPKLPLSAEEHKTVIKLVRSFIKKCIGGRKPSFFAEPTGFFFAVGEELSKNNFAALEEECNSYAYTFERISAPPYSGDSWAWYLLTPNEFADETLDEQLSKTQEVVAPGTAVTTVTLRPGTALVIKFEDEDGNATDGEFLVSFDTNRFPQQLRIEETAGLPGSVVGKPLGVLYLEDFSSQEIAPQDI